MSQIDLEVLTEALLKCKPCEYRTPERDTPIPVYLESVNFSGEGSVSIRPQDKHGFTGLSNNHEMREKDFILKEAPGVSGMKMPEYDYIELRGQEISQLSIKETQ